MTTFALLLARCGISHREAADLLNARLDTVKSWSAGRNPTPDGVIDHLRALYAKIDLAGREGAAQIDKLSDYSESDSVELGLSRSDDEARSIGWPCIGAHAAALGLTAALTEAAVEIVPRGKTLATRAAVKAHSR